MPADHGGVASGSLFAISYNTRLVKTEEVLAGFRGVGDRMLLVSSRGRLF